MNDETVSARNESQQTLIDVPEEKRALTREEEREKYFALQRARVRREQNRWKKKGIKSNGQRSLGLPHYWVPELRDESGRFLPGHHPEGLNWE